MSTAPRGTSIQEAYRLYRDGKLLVNRRYQRKLVWTLREKEKLIDSILSGYPLPLILLAENNSSCFEIIDGMQRLNAIFSFIETSYPFKNQYFDLNEFSRARQAQEQNLFKSPLESYDRLSKQDCANLLDYQLAITIFSAHDEEKTNEVFSRINSSGRQLSSQEKRQAGVVSEFSDLVRKVSSEIRGDVSQKTLKLFEMPMISIETKKETHGYQINAENTIWCHHGILSTKQLRESEDEDLIADVAASILLGSPLARSKERLDSLYDRNSDSAQKVENVLRQYPSRKLTDEIKGIFSLIDSTVKNYNSSPKALRKTVMGAGSSASSIKTPFYALFMAFYELVIKETKFPGDSDRILEALHEVNTSLDIPTHHATPEQRKKNINKIKGLIQDFFVKAEPSQLTHGPGLALDFENSLRRSKIETPRYEFKQGFLRLDDSRKFDSELIKKLARTACGIANIGPKSEGFIHIGVADREEHSNRIKELYSMEPVKINGFQVVGIDREAKYQNKTVEKYVEMFISELKKIQISEPLKSSILKNIDTIKYHNLSVIRIKIESQNAASYEDNRCFIRENNQTKEVMGQEIERIVKRFSL